MVQHFNTGATLWDFDSRFFLQIKIHNEYYHLESKKVHLNWYMNNFCHVNLGTGKQVFTEDFTTVVLFSPGKIY